jgi:hypothetical protein
VAAAVLLNQEKLSARYSSQTISQSLKRISRLRVTSEYLGNECLTVSALDTKDSDRALENRKVIRMKISVQV